MSIVYVAKAGCGEVEAVTFILIWKIITGIKKDKKGEDVTCTIYTRCNGNVAEDKKTL